MGGCGACTFISSRLSTPSLAERTQPRHRCLGQVHHLRVVRHAWCSILFLAGCCSACCQLVACRRPPVTQRRDVGRRLPVPVRRKAMQRPDWGALQELLEAALKRGRRHNGLYWGCSSTRARAVEWNSFPPRHRELREARNQPLELDRRRVPLAHVLCMTPRTSTPAGPSSLRTTCLLGMAYAYVVTLTSSLGKCRPLVIGEHSKPPTAPPSHRAVILPGRHSSTSRGSATGRKSSAFSVSCNPNTVCQLPTAKRTLEVRRWSRELSC